jgi:hypothetical protein
MYGLHVCWCLESLDLSHSCERPLSHGPKRLTVEKLLRAQLRKKCYFALERLQWHKIVLHSWVIKAIPEKERKKRDTCWTIFEHRFVGTCGIILPQLIIHHY